MGPCLDPYALRPMSYDLLDDLDFSADATFAADELASVGRAHAGAETTLAGTLACGNSMVVMHESPCAVNA